MRHSSPTPRTLAPWATAVILLLTIGVASPPAPAQESPDSATVEETSVRVGPEVAELSAEFADGSRLTVALDDGEVLVGGEPKASYERGGELEAAWREFLRDRVDPTGRRLAASVRAWSPPPEADTAAARALGDALARLAAGVPSPSPDQAEPGGEQEPGQAADTADLLDETETRVAPSGRSIEELQQRLAEFRGALERIGRGALDAARDAALVVHDDYEIEAGRTVDGAVALLAGELRMAGEVDGDVLVLDGDLVLEAGSSVEGDVLQVGGSVTNQGGRIAGELVSVGGREAIARDMEGDEDFGDRLEERIERRLEEELGAGVAGRRERGFGHDLWDNVTEGFGALFTTFSFFLVLAVLGAIPLYFAPAKFETMSDTVRRSFGRSFLLGLAGQVLFLPALVVLAVGILTIPLIPVFMFGMALAFVLGYVAVAYSLGHAIQARDYGWLRDVDPGPYRTLFLGIAALLSLFAVLSLLKFVEGIAEPLFVLTLLGAITVTWVAFTAGFGAVALSYAGTRDDYAGPGGPGAGGPGGGQPPVPAPGHETPPPGPETGGPPPAAEAPVEPGQGAAETENAAVREEEAEEEARGVDDSGAGNGGTGAAEDPSDGERRRE